MSPRRVVAGTPRTIRPDKGPRGNPDPRGESPNTGTQAAQSNSATTRVVKVAAAVIAQTTVLTALLFYFGWMHAYYFYGYFGVDSSTLGLTRQDFLMRAQDGLFIPALVIGMSWLPLLWLHNLFRRRVVDGATPGTRNAILRGLFAAGATLATVGLVNAFVQTPIHGYVALAPALLVVGVLLIVYSTNMRRGFEIRAGGARSADRVPLTAVAEWTAIVVVLALGLFWAVNDYSTAVGASRAAQQVRQLSDLPDVSVYSEKGLGLDAAGITEVPCADPDAAYRFRYDGLKLIDQAGDQYLFLPGGWTPFTGVAVLLPRKDSLRLEFRLAGAATTQSTC